MNEDHYSFLLLSCLGFRPNIQIQTILAIYHILVAQEFSKFESNNGNI